MEVLIYSRYATEAAYGKLTDLDSLLSASDVVSLHTALNDETRELINSEKLGKMKSTAWLINTGRGALVNEPDLAEALNNGTIAAAGLDVLTKEPPQADNPLLTAKNCVITPHISWATREARIRLLNVLIDNLSSFLSGGSLNKIN
jgi:glycerate dehydrogenase